MKLRLTVVTLSAVVLAGCFGKTLDFRNAEISNGKIYQQGANEPFSGKVTNIPYFKMPTAPLMAVFNVVSNLTQDGSYRETFFAGGLVAALGGGGNSRLLCEAEFDKGMPDGKAVCALVGQDAPLITMHYEKASLEGAVKVASLKDKSVTLAEAEFKNNVLEGELVVNNPQTGALLGKSNWQGGRLQGLDEAYSLTTGKLILKANYVQGKLDGEAVVYFEDGEEKSRETYQNGLLVKAINKIPPMGLDACTEVWKSNWILQQSQNGQSTYGSSNHLAEWQEQCYRGKLPYGTADSSKATQVSGTNDCVSAWTSAYRKEVGEDALVRSDQLGEWEEWCKQGKKP